jgi:hypothetical protein
MYLSDCQVDLTDSGFDLPEDERQKFKDFFIYFGNNSC